MLLTCKNCNKTFNGHTRTQKFCSRDCKALYYKNKPKSKNKREIVINTCIYCNSKFETRRSSQKFCNKDCMKKYNNKLLYEKKCPTCNNTFMPKRRDQNFCSVKCSKPRKNQYFVKSCSKCNNIFESRYIDNNICNDCRNMINGNKCSTWHGKWCLYNDIKIMSTYELRTCNILDEMVKKKIIHSWSYSKDKIKYIGNDKKQHNYIIDFKVYVNKNQFYFLEVKGVKKPSDDLKWSEVIKQGYDLNIWFLKDIEAKERELDISNDDINYLLKTCVIKK